MKGNYRKRTCDDARQDRLMCQECRCWGLTGNGITDDGRVRLFGFSWMVGWKSSSSSCASPTCLGLQSLPCETAVPPAWDWRSLWLFFRFRLLGLADRSVRSLLHRQMRCLYAVDWQICRKCRKNKVNRQKNRVFIVKERIKILIFAR